MKKLLLTLSLFAMGAFAANAADEYTDVLTAASCGITSGSSYATIEDIKFETSSAVYCINANSTTKYIQLRSSNNNSGIVSTTSGGRVKSIKVTWNSGTTSARAIYVYGNSSAYTSPSDLYKEATAGTQVAQLKYSEATDGVSTYTFDGQYTYIGIRSTSGALYLDQVDITWEDAGDIVFAPTFTPAAGCVVAGTEVSLEASNEGANIYYTTDGNEPTIDSTPYTAPIAINEAVTIKAIAELNGTVSDVATAAYTIRPEWENLDNLYSAAKGDMFVYNGEAVVVYSAKSSGNLYTYIYDNGVYGLIFDKGAAHTMPAAGEKIKAGWLGSIDIYNNLYQINVSDNLESDGEGVVPDPEIISDDEALMAAITAANQNRYYQIEKVSFEEDVAAATNTFTGEAYGNDVSMYRRFYTEAIEAGSYVARGFVNVYNDNVQFYPISLEKATGLQLNAIDQNLPCTYYNLQGQQVNGALTPGLYIVRQGNKAVKTLVK